VSHPVIKKTLDLGQSIWLDFISRQLMQSGELQRVIDFGVRGMTSNPTIFQKAISGSADYNDDIHEGIDKNWSPEQIFEHLAVTDVARACDALRPVFNASGGTDGFVSIEVSPKLAHDTNGSMEEGRRLWKSVNRPNLLIKIPGTDEGMPAIRQLLVEGINVNITLLFSLRQYRQVLDIYLDAMKERLRKGEDVKKIASVASFFVSRVDTLVDKQLLEKGHKDLVGKAAIANACLAYRHYLAMKDTVHWKELAAAGAHVQRPLWASTSTKNPDYPDVIYVSELVAEETVNTMPLETMEAWMDHGQPAARLLKNLEQADEVFAQITAARVSIDQATEELIEDGVVKFAASFDQLMDAIAKKVKAEAAK
jgi:transaldolase